MKTASPEHFARPHKNAGLFGIEPGMTIADFGSGSGHYVHAIAERLQNSGHVYAIDIQKDLLTRIKNDAHKNGYNNVEIIWGDLEQPGASKIADDHVDIVLMSNILFQLDHKDRAIEEARRILKPRGSLIIIDWSESFGGMGPTKKHVVNEDAAHALATAAGFKYAESFSAGAHHYGIVFIKGRAA